MMDLETFRATLRQAEPLTAPNLAHIMAAGRRIRRRRRAAAASGALVALALVLGVGVMVGGPRPSPSAPTPPASPVSPSSSARLSPSPSATQSQSQGVPLGAVVSTGTFVDEGEVVLFLVDHGHSTVAVATGLRTATGSITHVVESSVPAVLAQGFNGWYLGGDLSPARPDFGAYVGPAARIVVSAPGVSDVFANQATWDVDPNVVLFWYPSVRGNAVTIAAYDADGKALPAGNARRSVG